MSASLKDNLLDRMNATELAANQFRMAQTRDKLASGINSQSQAIQTHEQVGMYGDLQGIAGKSLQEIEGLELSALEMKI